MCIRDSFYSIRSILTDYDMVAELEKIQYDDGGGFRAAYINDTGGMWHFHPEYELVLNIKSNGTRIVGDSVELFDQYDMVLIAGNIPHCWNYYRQNNTLPENHGIVVNFKLLVNLCFLSMNCITLKYYSVKLTEDWLFQLKIPGKLKNFLYRWLRIRAVSYTHLRAHETVLDIVCSLLLK